VRVFVSQSLQNNEAANGALFRLALFRIADKRILISFAGEPVNGDSTIKKPELSSSKLVQLQPILP
jgi:hypothetical protein